MKLYLMPKEPSWWVWTLTVVFLVYGLAGCPAGYFSAIALSLAQTAIFALSEASWKSYPVQIRAAYTTLLMACQMPFLNWLIWLPVLGTLAFVLFGYCLMARMLSLCPWNRSQPVTVKLLRRTFFTPPVPGNARHGLPGSVCHLEARTAFSFPTTPTN